MISMKPTDLTEPLTDDILLPDTDEEQQDEMYEHFIKVHILIPVLLFFPKFGRIINISNNIIVPILFPDSNHPL